MRPPRIYAIDDNPADLTLLGIAFEECHIEVDLVTETNSTTALGDLRRMAEGSLAKPSLILIDLNMPRVNGYEVLVAKRLHPALKDVPVVVLTTSNSARDRAESQRLGAADFLVKATTLEGLTALVKRLKPYTDQQYRDD